MYIWIGILKIDLEYAKFSDLSQTSKNFSEDFWKTLERLSEDFSVSSNEFYAIRLSTKSSESLLSKVVKKLDIYFVCFIY